MEAINQQATIINAEGLIVGRMASIIAKRILTGEKIIIVNAEKAIISGKRKSKVAEAKKFLEVGAPLRGPFHYRRPDKIVKRTVRGMLPYKQPKGKQAYKRLKVYMGIPHELKDHKIETLEEAKAEKLMCPYLTVSDFAKELGWNAGE